MEIVPEAEKGLQPSEKTADLEKAPSCQNGVTTIVSSGVDDAGFRRQLGKRQVMMMTFGAGIGTGLWASAHFRSCDESLLTLARLARVRHSNTLDRVALQS